jgi:protein TonB
MKRMTYAFAAGLLLAVGCRAPESSTFSPATAESAVDTGAVTAAALPDTRDNPPFDQPPRLLTVIQPRYPEDARELGVEGIVKLALTISDEGRVLKAAVLESDSELLDLAAQEAAYQFVFEPARAGDQPVASVVCLPLKFALR